MPDTRPRITFDERGWCNACQWAEEKKTIDWSARWKFLEELCDEHRSSTGFDCIVPVSGGKDSSYVAHMMKHRMGMNPLCVTIRPNLELDVGRQNLINFINAGYDHIHVTPDPNISREIDKLGFVEAGRPLLGWQTAVQTSIFRLAQKLSIPLVMFGEDGETEYGGAKKLKHSHYYDASDAVNIYLEGHDPSSYAYKFDKNRLYLLSFPEPADLISADLCIAHWSYFENWDPYEHYLVAKEKCGLKEQKNRATASYNNFSQTDTALYNLHAWMMYLKFGFGRCSQDVGIDIRRGAMTRKQGIALVNRFDREAPTEFIPQYLEYFRMTSDEFNETLSKHVNRELFEYCNGIWEPTFAL
jgi:N-acetyl sugar amidotransferase